MRGRRHTRFLCSTSQHVGVGSGETRSQAWPPVHQAPRCRDHGGCHYHQEDLVDLPATSSTGCHRVDVGRAEWIGGIDMLCHVSGWRLHGGNLCGARIWIETRDPRSRVTKVVRFPLSAFGSVVTRDVPTAAPELPRPLLRESPSLSISICVPTWTS